MIFFTWDWTTFLIGLFAGVTFGTFVAALFLATREEQQKTGHNGPVPVRRDWGG